MLTGRIKRWHFWNSKAFFIIAGLTPTLIMYITFSVIPQLTAFYYPFTEYNGFTSPQWIGVKNFITMFQDSLLWNSLQNNFYFWFIATPINFFAGLTVAYILTKKAYRERGFYRVLYYFPAILPLVITALMWQFVLHGRYGVLNSVLNGIGFDVGSYYWLAEARTARLAMIFPLVWGGWSMNMLIFMGAIQSVSNSLYEFADLDGANDIVKLFYITVPVIWETIKTVIFFGIIALFGLFEPVLIMTNGGPAGATEVVGTYMYKMAFGDMSGGVVALGYASAIGLMLFVILSSISIFVFRIMNRTESIEMGG